LGPIGGSAVVDTDPVATGASCSVWSALLTAMPVEAQADSSAAAARLSATRRARSERLMPGTVPRLKFRVRI
jgi:hypothetical protein